MNKRIISFLLIVILFACSRVSIGEEIFTIRNNIHFGISREDVQNCEQQEAVRWNTIYYTIVESVTYARNSIEFARAFDGATTPNIYSLSSAEIFKTNIAGQDCYVLYRFDENDNLVSLEYLCEYRTSATNISDALQQKYGTPHYNSSKVPFDTLSSMYVNACAIKYPRSNCQQLAYAGWVLPNSDTYVAIESTNFTIDGKIYYECITYTAISAEDYNKVMNDTQKSINSDL